MVKTGYNVRNKTGVIKKKRKIQKSK
uniref:Uncharacterized protein n=1 Tax=Anguilla anguilla TaxID=7936 RepID=A0A0E9QPP5_ANGAN